ESDLDGVELDMLRPPLDLGRAGLRGVGEVDAVEPAEDAVALAQGAGSRFGDLRLAQVIAHDTESLRRRRHTTDRHRQRGHEVDEPGEKWPALEEVVV